MLQQPEERFTYLFNRYYNRTATPLETDEFLALVEQTQDQVLDEHLSKAWFSLSPELQVIKPLKSESIREQILTTEVEEPGKGDSSDKKTVNLKWIVGIAASLALVLCCWFYLRNVNTVPKATAFTQSKIKHDIPPGGYRAFLTLADGSKVSLDTLKPGTVARQGNIRISQDANGKLTYVATPQGRSPVLSNEVNTLTTPNGGQYKLVLADGTKVWLNAASSLQFPVAFNGPTRNVTLTGEAYFEVSKNKKQPFLVKSGDTYVKVLGTHFNIMSYENEAIKKTTLLEGSIEISNRTNSYRVKPGEQVQILRQQLSMPQKVDTAQEMGWKNGFFDFRNADIDYIMRQVSRWYGVDIKYEGKIPKGLYTGRISRAVKISKLLEMLQYTGVQYNLVNNTIIVRE
ncbi:FecR family protein [Pedobacter sp. MC2016-24]|uniref:FecR family protein n=1 Tax=Pedobacter sp. MC2016-24 TaxID=2780090 RepID=UPI00187F99F8|nr:FecR family protein [Pedobacter sp. MC2016-24]MBE9599452.1 FecR domain-containing protein [Pedobacter sp. MC2016-24]